MSEFSDSVHFYAEDINTLKKKLTKSAIKAVIIGENNVTVSTLIRWEDKEKVISYGRVLLYSYGEDHGLWLRFYHHSNHIGSIEIVWDDLEYGVDENEAELTVGIGSILFKHGFISEDNSKKLMKLLDTFNKHNQNKREKFVDELGKLLNLFAFRYLSCEDISFNLNSLKERFTQFIYID